MKRTFKYIKSLLIFLVISGASVLAVSLIYDSPPDFSGLTTGSILIAGAIALASLYFEIEKIRLIGLSMKTKIPFKAALESVMGREFLSAITPFGGGGQPLEVFILNKYGLQVGQAITVAYLETFYTIITLFVAGMVSLFFYHSVLASNTMKVFLLFSIGAIIYFVTFCYFSISRPRMLKKIGFFFVNLLLRLKLIKVQKTHGIKQRIVKEIQVFNHHIKASLKSQWYLIAALFLFTLIFWVLRFLAIYPVLLVMGVAKISIIRLISYQMIITFVNYFVFTPGSSGTTEWLGAALFTPFIADATKVPTFIILWRFFSFHLIVLFCGAVIFKVIRLFTKEKEQDDPQESGDHHR